MKNTMIARFFGGGQGNLSSLIGIGAATKPFCAAERRTVKSGFTLAEVLITLSIIGVVAAMTLPTLVNKYQSKVLETGFKKSYSNISKAVMYTKTSLGESNLHGAYTVYDKENDVYPNAERFYEEFYKSLGKTTKVDCYFVTNYSGTTKTDRCGWDYPNAVYILGDGSSVGVWINSGIIKLWVDTNGPYKKPNRWGFDIFQFALADKTDKVLTMKATKEYNEDELEDEVYPWIAGDPCYKSSTQVANGVGCSWYAMNNINPDDETKTYWDNLPK